MNIVRGVMFLAVLTYNVKLLPRGITSNGPGFMGFTDWKYERFMCILENILDNKYDIVALQEVFHPEMRGLASNVLSENGYYVYGDQLGGVLEKLIGNGNGLFIASRYPPVEHSQQTFNFSDSSPLSSDYFVNKGALRVEVALPNGKFINVITSHLQSSNGDTSMVVRGENLAELSRFVSNVTETSGSPAIVLGDFNINGTDPVKRRFIKDQFSSAVDEDKWEIEYNMPEQGKEKASFPDDNSLLDYIFLVKPHSNSSRYSSTQTSIQNGGRINPYGDLFVDLSDHLPATSRIGVSD